MREFVTIDFETANEQRRSACSVGLVHFDEQGQPINWYSTLLHPHADCDYFLPMNIMVHGIRPEAVADAPTWADVAPTVYELIGDRPLVAHNMAFDGYVLSDLATLYGLPDLPNRRMCTLRLARRLLAQQVERKSLDNVYEYYFPGDEFEHHEASADALACGRIFARMQQDYTYEELEQACPITRSFARRFGGTAGAGTPSHTANSAALDAEALIEQFGKNPEALRGEHVCITGTLYHGQRAAVQKLIEAAGGVVEKSMTRRTTILVIGTPNPVAWAANSSASRKLAKAEQLREKGSPIVLLTEDEFFHQLAADSADPSVS